tara:strand:- start:1988 stop:2350 length:363 start_codon:yes stop_codon:yes gene_type:complete
VDIKKMSKVFITQEKMRKNIAGDFVQQFDLTPALKYGKLEVLIPAGRALFAPVLTIRTLKEKLADFSDDDYLLTVGDPSVIAAAAMIAGEKNKGRVKILKWDRIEHDYISIQLDTSGKAV